MSEPLAVTSYTLVSALGAGRAATLEALQSSRSGLALQRFETAEPASWLGVVLEADEVRLPEHLAQHDCRNNRIAELGLRADDFAGQARRVAQKVGCHRVGVFLGTSTSAILETEVAYRHRHPATGALPPDLHYATTHNTYSVAGYVRAALGLTGPAFVVSTACSSSAKVFAAAQRFISMGLIDAAVVGGVDSLCMTTLYGFRSLELVSPE
ncbi:MAG TPA: beta-ketoacyl synthase N-terminal-like domain-containing protein, partial [Rubrivivax sp.]|nr:beta-ketoacyl synthase N-terminal-like domain-containing protein [Rubrivivax sp.]